MGLHRAAEHKRLVQEAPPQGTLPLPVASGTVDNADEWGDGDLDLGLEEVGGAWGTSAGQQVAPGGGEGAPLGGTNGEDGWDADW